MKAHRSTAPQDLNPADLSNLRSQALMPSFPHPFPQRKSHRERGLGLESCQQTMLPAPGHTPNQAFLHSGLSPKGPHPQQPQFAGPACTKHQRVPHVSPRENYQALYQVRLSLTPRLQGFSQAPTCQSRFPWQGCFYLVSHVGLKHSSTQLFLRGAGKFGIEP